jgi:endoglucanase
MNLLNVAAAVVLGGLITFASAAPPTASTLSRLRAQGTRIVDAEGRPVALRGVNLGNWLLIEPGVYNGGIGAFDDQDTLFQVLRDRFGEAERRRLIDLYRDHFITTRDFDNVKAFGFNIVRIGIDYELLEDDANPMKLRPDAFKYLDFAVAQAKQRGLYVLFDIHGAPGHVVNGKQSGRYGPAEFWDNPVYQERTLWLWEEIARRYKGEEAVFGYEALNEPWGKSPEALRAFCVRWYDRVRPIDPEAILVFPGWSNGISFYGKPADAGWKNVAFDMHIYPGLFRREKPTLESHHQMLGRGLPRYVQTMKEFDAPLFIGEFNVVHKTAGGGEMIRRYYDFAAEQGWPLTFWTLKELTPQGGVDDSMWMLTTNATPLPKVDIHTSSAKEIEDAFRALSTMPLETDQDVLHWLTTSTSPGPMPPSTRPASQPTTRPQ